MSARLTSAHTGSYLAQKLSGTVIDFHIEKKLHGVTVDNAENNTTMVKAIPLHIPEY
ncbi:hypothetical protein BD311DRAFT_677014 [Dichomitus squalens]|uniref:Uncharacterized protein n=1 Tax=Dichomitus squalens TaxID=114155 RepID=A0A4Q9M6S8_9APHY|nr:hypothetical protein BD311DRAFT_677014 [Dichomitus squalens]